MLNNLLCIPEKGIAVLVNQSNKTFYIIHSSELLLSISKTIKELRTGVHRSRELQDGYNTGYLELRLLYTFNNKTRDMEIRATASYECRVLERDGYRNLKKKSPGVYDLVIDILPDFRPHLIGPHDHSRSYLVYVFARMSNFSKRPIGIFETMAEADEWLNKTYGKRRERVIPRVADNKITKEFEASESNTLGMKFRRRKPKIETPG